VKKDRKSNEDKRKREKLSRREFIKQAGIVGAAMGSTALIAATHGEGASVQIAEAATAVELNLYNPSGAREVTKLFAPRLDTLAGKTICELSNNGWQAHRTFPLVRELLKRQFPTVKIIPFTEFPSGTDEIQTKKTIEALKKIKCDAVITGNAG
jgi:hypothetical protein